MKIVLTVASGEHKGLTFVAEQAGVYYIGRSSGLDLSLTDDPYISRRHCSISLSPEVSLLQDLNSLSGTFLNRRRTKQAPLSDGDMIEIGRSVLQVRLVGVQPVKPAVDATPTLPAGQLDRARRLGYAIAGQTIVPTTPNGSEASPTPGIGDTQTLHIANAAPKPEKRERNDAPASYLDFILTVEHSSSGYTVAVKGPGDIEVPPEDFELSLTGPLGETLAHLRQGKPLKRAETQITGAVLYSALFQRPVARAFGRAYYELPPNTHLRIKLNVLAPELVSLPWELLYDPEEEYFLGARYNYPIVRYVSSTSSLVFNPPSGPLRVLYVQSQPEDKPVLPLEVGLQTVTEALGSHAQITVLRSPTISSLNARLCEPYHILHFDGHSGFDENTGASFLYLLDEQGKSVPLSGERLGAYLSATTVRMAVIMACEKHAENNLRRLVGFSHQLMKSSSLAAVIGAQLTVSETSLLAFSYGFYNALAASYGVDSAVAEGRSAVLIAQGGNPSASPDWASPVLFMRSADGNLFRP